MFHTLDRTTHKYPYHIQIILFSSAVIRSTTYLLVFCTQLYEYRQFCRWIWELAKIITVLDNNLISKMSYKFPLLLILISVPDDGFKLQAEICIKSYTLEELSTDLFIYNTQTQPDVLSKNLTEIYSDFFHNLNSHSY